MKKLLFAVLLSIGCFVLRAQQADSARINIITADSLASGNYKDVLTSFFQLAFENLTGPEKDLKFSSNPFAVMLRANPKLLLDTSYRKFHALRNLNFSFDLKLDSNFKFNGFASGVNYALINKRDYTIYKEFPQMVRERNRPFERLQMATDIARSQPGVSPELRRKIRDQTASLLSDTGFKYSQLDPEVKAVIDKIIRDSSLTELQRLAEADGSFAERLAVNFEDLKSSFKNRLLWTVGVTDTTYKDQLLFSNIVFSTQLLKGITNPKAKHGIELDLKGMFNIVDDTLRTGRDLRRSLLNFEGGFNYVWRSHKTDLSFFEAKFSASYSRIFNGIYADERKQVFTLNGVVRVRIFDDIWVPVQVKYDPDTGNVFGFLNVKANFTALKKILARG